jgi:hypothetical protein
MSARSLALAAGLLAVGAWGAACSESNDEGSKVYGGAGPGGASSGSAGSAGTGIGGSGAIGVGGIGGAIAGASGADGSSGTGPIDDACASVGESAKAITLPADLIWAVDQSGSMDQETQYVAQQINNFVTRIQSSNIDYRVVMIAAKSGENALCVPAPLSDGMCGNAARFRLVDTHVDSNDALSLIIGEYPKYSDFLRPNSFKHIIVVTDDNATDGPINSPQALTNALGMAQPAGIFARWKLHAIYAYGSVPIVGCIGPFGTGALYGTVYEQLVRQTMGAQGEICVDNWQPVFDAITAAVVQGATLSCEYVIPTPDSGTLDPTKVNVDYLRGGMPPANPVYRVNSQSECTVGTGQGGWYFDNNAAPTKIHLCPGTCTAIQTDAMAKIDVKFGCASIYKPPQ